MNYLNLIYWALLNLALHANRFNSVYVNISAFHVISLCQIGNETGILGEQKWLLFIFICDKQTKKTRKQVSTERSQNNPIHSCFSSRAWRLFELCSSSDNKHGLQLFCVTKSVRPIENMLISIGAVIRALKFHDKIRNGSSIHTHMCRWYAIKL